MPRRTHIDGHLPASHPLSPRSAFQDLSRIAKALVHYSPEALWEQDTARLPRPLRALRRRLRAFAEREIAPRALACDQEPHPSVGELRPSARAVLAAAAAEGLLSDLLPWPFGSASPALLRHPLSMPQTLKTEELAAVDGGLMLLVCANALGIAPILISGERPKLRRFVLPAFRQNARGDPHVFAYAITEPGAGSDVEEGHGAARLRPGVIARAEGSGFRLRGRKCFISGGDIAKITVVFAALEGEGVGSWTAFVVPSSCPGFRVTRTELKMGMRASGAAELELDDAFVPADDVLGGLRKGWALNRATLNLSRVPVAGMAVGFARAAVDETRDFVCNYRLGSKFLIDYQDIQLELAQMIAETRAARAMVWSAAGRAQPLQHEASAAKLFCSDTAVRVCTRAMDILGNHAVLHERRVEKAFRDARLTQIFEGTNEINRLSMIEDLQEELLGQYKENPP
jgi:alkylation response protein AidB-like acyl-CoA dehydrogenase